MVSQIMWGQCINETFATAGTKPTGWAGTGSVNNSSDPAHAAGGSGYCWNLGSGQTAITPAVDYPQSISFYLDASSSGGQVVTLAYSINGGSYVNLTPTFSATIAGATVGIADLPAAVKTATAVKIRFTSGSNTAYVDNVVVTCGTSTPTQATTPTITVAGTSVGTDTYANTATVTLVSTGSDAIYYTTDGSDPTISSTLYSAPFTITTIGATTIKAMATVAGLTNSTLATKTITIVSQIPPTNDLCSNAQVLVAGATANGTLLYSTYAAPVSAGNSGKDVWYQYTATLSGSHTFTVQGFKIAPNDTSADVDLQLFGGSCPTSSTYLVNSTTSTNIETITTNLTAGTTYYLRVFAYNTNAEASTFTVGLTAPAPPTPPVITNEGALPNATVGTAIATFNVTSSGSAATYSSANLPSGLSISSAGAITGTPTVAGTNIPFTVTATNSEGSDDGNYTITIAQGVQTSANNVSYNLVSGAANTTLSATTNAGKTITYVSNNNNVIEIQNGNEIHVVGVGSTTITASASGDANWNAYNVTINVDVISAVVYQKITSLADLTDGEYVIADANDEVAASNVITNGALVTNAITPTAGQIINPVANTVWNLVKTGSVFTIQSVASSKFVNFISSTNLSVVDAAANNNQKWDITYTSGSNAHFTIASAADASRILKYNSGLTTPGFKAYTSSTQSPEVSLYKKVSAAAVTTWNGTAWNNGVPTSSTDAIIEGSYSTTTQPNLVGNTITINNGGVLEVTNGKTVTATNVIVNDGGNFIQRDGSTLTNTGAFNVLKNTTSVANKYVFWASPTVSQNMFGIYTTAPQYVMTYNSATDYYTTLSNPATSTPGVGYSVKMPATNAVATFGGASAQPNNGNVSVTLNNTSTNKYNLIGNPYSSNVDLNAFYNANSSSVGSTFWFWDNTSNSVTTQAGNTTTNVGYATYNAAGSGTWIEAPTSLASHSGNSATIGQGFIVEATGTTATFTNAMRVSTTGNTFNKLNGNDTGKFWLKLATPYGSHTTLAVNYETGAQNSYDKFDSNAMGTGSDAFYSTVGAEKLVIQGRSPFTIDDVVPLGNKHFEAGNFVISLTQKEGIFNNGQAIYLHDKDLGTYTNLQAGSYSFSANAGEFTNRFEIVYKLNVLGTQETEKATFEVYRDGEDFVAINSKNIEKLEVFDASGRKVMELKPNTDSVKFKLQTKGMYILRAISAGKEYTKKLVK